MNYPPPDTPYRDYKYANEWKNNVNNHCARLNGSASGGMISEDEYQIYSVLVDYYKTKGVFKSSEWFVEKRVVDICDDEKGYPLDDDFIQSKNIKVVEDTRTFLDELEEHNKAAALSGERISFPRVAASFSRVAFNEDHSEAYTLFSVSCGQMCGGSDSVVLKRENDQWFFYHEAGYGAYY